MPSSKAITFTASDDHSKCRTRSLDPTRAGRVSFQFGRQWPPASVSSGVSCVVAHARHMTTTTDIEWHRVSRLPTSVRLHYTEPDGRHPLTPDEIRQRYVREVSDSSLVIWRSLASGRFGFRAGIDELAWELSQVRSIEFAFCRPAKGGGSVLLYVHEQQGRGVELAISSDRFEPALLDWFRPILRLLTEMFPDRVTERDDGCDA